MHHCFISGLATDKTSMRSSSVLTQQAKLSRVSYCLHAVLHSQFGKDMAHMAFDRINDNDQALAPISWLDAPRASNWRTSSSRSLKGSGSGWLLIGLLPRTWALLSC